MSAVDLRKRSVVNYAGCVSVLTSSVNQCDGAKPLCRRCYLNGTQCTYTPHKSRSHCACTGQTGEEGRQEGPIPDVYIFPNSMYYMHSQKDVVSYKCCSASPSSFHTWSTSSSPEQSPSTSGLDTPSPTFLSHDEMFETNRNSLLTNTAHLSQTHLAQPQSSFQRNPLYNQRSCSVPNFHTVITPPPPRTTSSSTLILPTPFPSYSLEPITPHEAYSSVHDIDQQDSRESDVSPTSAYSDLMLPHLVQQDVDSIFAYDPAYSYDAQASDAAISRSFDSFYSSASPSSQPSVLYPVTPIQEIQQNHCAESYDVAFNGSSTQINSHLLLDHTHPSLLQSHISFGESTAFEPEAKAASSNITDGSTQMANTAQTQVYIQSQPTTPTSSSSAEPHLSLDQISQQSSPTPQGTVGADYLLPFGSLSQLPHGAWSNELAITQTHSEPNSAFTTPTVYSSLEYYDWSQ